MGATMRSIFRISAAAHGMGLAAGFCAAVVSIGKTLQHADPFGRVLLGASAVVGIVSVFLYAAWVDDLQTRCARYEALLRKNGMEPQGRAT
jgi:hypothetical protein